MCIRDRANAVQIVKNLPNQNILFIPDKNLGRYVAEQVKEKNVMLVKGYCPVHEEMRVQEIQELKQQHPLAEVLAHPECNAAVLSIADYIGSTTVSYTHLIVVRYRDQEMYPLNKKMS